MRYAPPSAQHGGLTNAAHVNVRSCIAKIAICSPTVHREPRAGGVSPPWFATATPPAFVSTPPAVPRDFAEASLQVRFPNTHGGLTPVALVNVRFCIAKIVIISPDGRRSRNKSGGRKPPVVRETCLQVICRTPCATLHRVHTHLVLCRIAAAQCVVSAAQRWVHRTTAG
jgi:hypothetical protein